jgi:hypothetical protein
MRALFLSTLCMLAAGCVYPRRTTSLMEVTRPDASESMSAPDDIWRITIVGATIVPRKNGDLPWDEGEGLPDAFVRVFRGEQQLYESPVIDDSLEPEWDAVLPSNIRVGSNAQLRFELWDRDQFGSDPVGFYRSSGRPPTAMPDADARLPLAGGSYVTVRFQAPRAHRGVGIAEYEVHPDALVVIRVLPHSPASRADIEPGDRIVRIGDRRVSSMSANDAASELSQALSRRHELGIQNARGERTATLDRGYVWLAD